MDSLELFRNVVGNQDLYCAGWVSAVVQVAGALFGASEGKKADIKEQGRLKRQGIAQQFAAEFSAEQMEEQAGVALAASQQAANEERRMSAVLQSRALAVAGASGAGVSDPTMLRIVGSIAEEGELAAQTRRYEGTEAARSLRIQAEVARYEGRMAREGLQVQSQAIRQAGDASRTASLISTAASVWDKYDSSKGNRSTT